MKVVPQIREEVELALDFVESAAAAALRIPLVEGTAIRARLAAARDALVACHAEAGFLARLHQVDGARPRARPTWLRLRLLRCRVRQIKWHLRRDAAAPARLDLLYGQRAITRYLGLTRAQGRSVVANGGLPTFKIAGVTCARRSSIRRHLRLLER